MTALATILQKLKEEPEPAGTIVAYQITRARLLAVVEFAEGLRSLIMSPDNVLEDFEALGDWYYRETGFLRPGKSEPMETGRDSNDRENVKRFADWFDEKKREKLSTARLAAALEDK